MPKFDKLNRDALFFTAKCGRDLYSYKVEFDSYGFYLSDPDSDGAPLYFPNKGVFERISSSIKERTDK